MDLLLALSMHTLMWGALGDINGDGYPDFVFNPYDLLKAYIVFGKNGKFSNIDATTLNGSNGGFIIKGGIASSVGDINGDNYSDIVLNSVPMNYIIFGRKGNFFNIDLSTLNKLNGNNGGFIVSGLSNGISGAGDINHDGYDDFITGFNNAAQVIFGRPSGFINFDVTSIEFDGINGFVIPNMGGAFVNGIKDINGDGVSDIIAGSSVIFGRKIVQPSTYTCTNTKSSTAACTNATTKSSTSAYITASTCTKSCPDAINCAYAISSAFLAASTISCTCFGANTNPIASSCIFTNCNSCAAADC